MERNEEHGGSPLTSALGSLIGCLTERHPTQALRVTVAAVLQRDSVWSESATAEDARQIWRGLERGPLRDASAPVLAGLAHGERLHHGGARAWNKSLLDAWRSTFRAPPPCRGPWRALRLAVAIEEGPGTSDLAADLGIPYACIYTRRGRIDLRVWRAVFGELRGVVVPGVVDHGEDAAGDHEYRERRAPPEREPREEHSWAEDPHVPEPHEVGFHVQHPWLQSQGFVIREVAPRIRGRGGMFMMVAEPPTTRAIASRKPGPST